MEFTYSEGLFQPGEVNTLLLQADSGTEGASDECLVEVPLADPRLAAGSCRIRNAPRPRPGRWCTERCQARGNALPNHSPRISRDLDFFFQHGCLDVDDLASRLFAVGRSPSPGVRPECRRRLL